MNGLDLTEESPTKRHRYTEDDAKGAVLMANEVDGEGAYLHTQVDAAANFGVPMTSFMRAQKQYDATGDVKLPSLGRPNIVTW